MCFDDAIGQAVVNTLENQRRQVSFMPYPPAVALSAKNGYETQGQGNVSIQETRVEELQTQLRMVGDSFDARLSQLEEDNSALRHRVDELEIAVARLETALLKAGNALRDLPDFST